MLLSEKTKQIEALKAKAYDAIIEMNKAQAVANDLSKEIESIQKQIKEIENEKNS